MKFRSPIIHPFFTNRNDILLDCLPDSLYRVDFQANALVLVRAITPTQLMDADKMPWIRCCSGENGIHCRKGQIGITLRSVLYSASRYLWPLTSNSSFLLALMVPFIKEGIALDRFFAVFILAAPKLCKISSTVIPPSLRRADKQFYFVDKSIFMH